MLALVILVALAVLGLGVWLGLPGRYDQSLEDVERCMLQGSRTSRKIKRHPTPLAWVQRRLGARGSRTGPKRGLHLKHPDER